MSKDDELYECLDRQADEHEAVFFGEHRMPLPDRILATCLMDKAYRDDYGFPVPFPQSRDPKWAGCYLLFDSYEWLPFYEVLSIYAGRTCTLPVRLWQHCIGQVAEGKRERRWRQSAGNKLDIYWHEVFSGVLNKKLERQRDLEPVGLPRIAIWYVHDEERRMQFEHELIGATAPILNMG